MSRYRPYPAYKDSGVAWLGRVPEHWDTLKLGQFGIFTKGSGGTKQDELPTGVPCIRYGDLYTTHTHFIEHSRSFVAPDRASDYTPIKYGDTLFAASGETVDEIGKSATNLLGSRACCGGDIIIFRPTRSVDPRFMGYAADCNPSVIQKAGMGRGFTVAHIYPSQLKNLHVTFPPVSEQHYIASFLDRETARIDALIEKKQRLIELLKEKRQALITQAVTKGLDPNVPMKDSGVEWLGEVPAHWAAGPLKRFWSVTDCKHITAEFVDDGIPLASIREVQSTYVDLLSAKRTTGDFYALLIEGGRKPLPGDIVYSRNATVGEAAMVSGQHELFAMGQDVCLLRRSGNHETRFFHYQLRSAAVLEQLEVLMVGATFRRVNVDDIRNYAVVVPPPNEQALIADFLDKQTARVDSVVGKAEQSIALLTEHRSALITATVTGQIDVRDAA